MDCVLAYFDTDFASDDGTESVNMTIELGCRITWGFRHFEHYRRRMLLFAGGLNVSYHAPRFEMHHNGSMASNQPLHGDNLPVLREQFPTKSVARAIGSAFSVKEQALLDLLCRGSHPLRGLARNQLRFASWGGYQYDECDCFLISVPKLPKTSRIRHDGGPFSVVEVSRANEGIGQIELWVVNGYLHSVDYMTYDDHENLLPDPEDANLELLD